LFNKFKMNKKILIIILIGILAAGGFISFLVWKHYSKPNLPLKHYCQTDSDCILSGNDPEGFGICVNKEWYEEWKKSPESKKYKWDCEYTGKERCACVNNKCQRVDSERECGVKETQVIITTDKTEYDQGETIKISVKNNLDKPIWYRRQIPLEFPPFWELEKFEENKWKTVYFYLPVQEKEKEICILRFHERPTWYIDELKPNSKISYQWNQKVCIGDKDNGSEPEFIQKGRYRFAFRFGLRKIHLSNYQEEPWKGKEDLMDTKIIYSNEFIIKEKSEGILSDTEPPSTLLLIIPEKNQRGNFIELTGRIYSMGSPPVIQLGVETLDGEVYGIVGERTKELWKFRDKTLHLKGYLAGRTPRTEKSIEVIDYRAIK